MNRRINKILLDALHKKEDSLVNYAKVFKVSEQTIRNDLKEINYQLENSHVGKGIYLEDGYLKIPKEVNVKELFKTYASFQQYHLTLDERRTILALLLITSHDYVTTYYLSEYLLVSRNTLVSDIEALKKWFAKNDLVLLSHIGKGYKVAGNELKIRNAMTKLIIFNGLFDYGYDYALGWENNIFQNLLLDIIDPDNRYQTVSLLLMEAEKEEQLQLSDFSYQEMICYLIIMIERIKFNHPIEASERLNDMMESSKSNFAKTIARKIETCYAISAGEGELGHLISILRRKSYIKNNGRKIDSIEIQILINEFIFNLAREMEIKYYLNSDLFDLLENHLKLLIYRLSLNDSVVNVLFDEIYQSYPEMFEVVKRNLEKIEQFLAIDVQPNELSFIVMYVMAIVENSHNTHSKGPIRLRIVCNSGSGTAQLIKVKLLSAFPQIDIVSVDSSHALQKSQPEDQDLIVSTVPLTVAHSPVVLVNPILTEQDIVRIQKVLYKIKPRHFIDKGYLITKEEAMIEEFLPIIQKYIDDGEYQNFLSDIETFNQLNERLTEESEEICRLTSILTPDRVLLEQHSSNWQFAVEAAGKFLLRDNLITPDYIQAMIQMVVDYDSYIVISPGVAIPHAEFSHGAKKIGASFVRLKEPVAFNHQKNDPVKYVIAFSLPEGVSIGTCLYYFTEILATEDFLTLMDQCRSEEAVMSQLKKLEDKVMGFPYE
ncbi:BglG family transcription antiterminator [Enterococcus gilvus]|uniref:Uncharacterized protein n=1 Tax=Enterococcus gilvus ATCC BAA-350 TaxID=1158614 RepID=R2V819_9ENTE|nr:BglG family transcription antiterminator [Enterococcus gilvus]EOI53880.1 hypothetical protein UKC_03833 [Enterococcus gilvus ATCC BAA-350]EOW80845.1 hypothetical protein I592_00129 [Enterococcus gilvus ATCC BAA-350]OJG40751.1 hypothetical protein RV02_GL001835 [Enterococcus gilvus]